MTTHVRVRPISEIIRKEGFKMSNLFFCFAEICKEPGMTKYWAKESEDEKAVRWICRVTDHGKEVTQYPEVRQKHNANV